MPLLDDLVFSYELDEASGDAIDAHGNAPNLTENGTIGSSESSRDFESDDATDFFSAADAAVFRGGDSDWTICYEFKPESTKIGQIIVGKDTDSPANSRDYTIDWNAGNDGKHRFYFNGGGGANNSVIHGTVQATGTRALVIVYHDAANNQIGIHVNADAAVTADTTGTAPQESAAEFRIGARQYSGFPDYADGLIRRVRKWSRLLTADEKTELYNGGSFLPYSSFTGTSGPTAGTAAAAASITCDAPQPPGGLTGVASANFTLTASSAVGSNTDITLNETGAAGTNSPTTPQITSGNTSVTFTRTPSATGLTVIEPEATGFTSAAQAVVTIATNTGGTAPYSNQLQRSAVGAASWSNVGSPASGATATLTDTTVTPGTSYDYRVVVTDDAAATANSNTVTIAVPDAVRYTSYSANRYLRTFIAPYGAVYTGEEAAIGYTIYEADGTILLDHTTGQTNELPGADGIYAADIYLDEGWIGAVVWDAPSGAIPFVQAFWEEEPLGTVQVFLADYGATHTGLEATLGYTVYEADGTTLIAHTTSGVNELPGSQGIYAVEITFSSGDKGVVVWDAPTGAEPISQAFLATAAGGGTASILGADSNMDGGF